MGIVTIAIIIVNVLMSLKGFNDRAFFEKYKFNIGKIKQGEKLRVFSSAFLHADYTHLFFNMYTLYLFSRIVEGMLGAQYFLLIYIASLLLGSYLSFYFHKNENYYSAIGASGAVTGILYSSILLMPNMSLYLFFIPIPIPAYIFGIGYLFYSIYGMKKSMGNIGHDAHFGGAVGGLLVTIFLVPQVLQSSLFVVILLLVPIGVLFYMIKNKKI